jgi:hypothetical protein
MRNKKSGLMTLNHSFGYFSGGGGIAGNVEHIRRQGLELLNFQLRTDDK